MKSVKGITQIEFFDKDGIIVEEVKEKNIITDAIQNILDCANLICKNPLCLNTSKDIDTINSLKKIQDYIGGILLFEDKLQEMPNLTTYDKFSIASAGGPHDLSNPLRGNLNTTETGDISVDGKQAYRWVWDFGTANANCTFKTVCLTVKSAGDRVGIIERFTSEHILYNEKNYFNFLSSRGNTITNKGQLVTVDGQSDSIIKIEKRNSISIKDNLNNIFEKKYYKLEGYSNFSSSHFYEDNNLRFVAKKITNEKFYLMSVDVDSLEIINEIELMGIAMTQYSTFSLLDNYLLYNYRLEYISSKHILKVSVYDMDTKEVKSDLIINDVYNGFYQDYQSNYLQRILTIKSNGKYKTSFHCGSVEDKQRCNVVYIHSLNEDGVQKGTYYNNNNYYICPLVSFDINKDVSLWFSTYGTNSNKGLAFPFFNNWEPLFTVNVLSSPVTKTEANTMKITYTLIYD